MGPSLPPRPGDLLLVARRFSRVRPPSAARKRHSPLRSQVVAQWEDMPRPLVGITTYVTPASFGAWMAEAALIPYDYVRAVARAGGRAVLVPPADDGVGEILDAVDGLVFSGGSDLDPDLYGQEAHPETTGIVPERDSAELVLLQAALERDLPVLAICRGSQVLNVALGGDLVQHLPEHVGHERHRETPGEFSEHDVELEPGTRLAELLGARVPIKSHHHQGFARLGNGLRPAARGEDGSVEALEAPDRRFAVGVLWHAEAGDDGRLFEALVAEASAYRALRG
jgi:putative glutamine amidotransferase